MKKKILLTGANGYISNYVIYYLIKNNYDVIALTYKHNRSMKIKNTNILYYDINLAEEDAVDKLIEKFKNHNIDAVIHNAAVLGNPVYDENYNSNFLTTKTMIDFCKKKKINRYIYMSTISSKRIRKGPYGQTKLDGEKLTLKSDLNYTIYVPEMVIGRESLGFNRVVKNILRFVFFVPLIGFGNYLRNPVYVHDLSKTIVENIFNEKSYKKRYEIAAGKPLSFKNFIRKILNVLNKKKILIPVPVWFCVFLGKVFERLFTIAPFTSEHALSLTENTDLDITDLQNDLNYKPTDLDIIIQKAIKKINNTYNEQLKSHDEQEFDLEYFKPY